LTIQLTAPSSSKTKDKSSLALQAEELIIPASQVEPYLKLCIYSRNGIGKTTFSGSSELKTLIIDCNEKGTLSIRKRANVSVIRIEHWEQLDWIYWYLRTNKHGYEVVSIDTITGLAVLCMKWVLKEDASRDLSRDPLMPGKQHWGKLGQAMNDAITRFRNLDMHVIFTAQEKTSTVEDDETGGTLLETHPALSPAPRSTLLGAVDIIGRLYTREVEVGGKKQIERRMLVGPHPRYVSKDRTGALGMVQRRPTLAGFIEKGLATDATAGN
jgi:phage nucleotide-binding protein